MNKKDYEPELMEVLASRYMNLVYMADEFKVAANTFNTNPKVITDVQLQGMFQDLIEMLSPPDEERKLIEECLARHAISKAGNVLN